MRSGSPIPSALRSAGFGRVTTPIVAASEAGRSDEQEPRDDIDIPFAERVLLARREAARVLAISVSTLDELVADGQVIACRIGRKPLFHRADLNDFANRLREVALNQTERTPNDER